MTAINEQSKNEVKDLLNEYVVSPLNTDILAKLTQMGRTIEESGVTVEEEIGKVSSSVCSRIDTLRQKLDDNKDDFESVKDCIDDSREDANEKIAEASAQILKELSDIQQNINMNLNGAEKKIISEYSGGSEKIDRSISDLGQNANEIISQLKALNNMLNDRTNALSDLLSGYVNEINKAINDNGASMIENLRQTETLTEKKCGELLDRIESMDESISSSIDNQNATIDKYYAETGTAIQNAVSDINEKSIKKLFITSLSFGIANFLGIVLMIILFFIK